MIAMFAKIEEMYAAVEELKSSALRRKPVAVTKMQANGREIVISRNAAAARFGIKEGMSESRAYSMCENIICKRADDDACAVCAASVRKIYMEYSSRVEPFGLDGAWIDLSDICKDSKEAVITAEEIKRRVMVETGLAITAGISFCVDFARIAAENGEGISVIERNDVAEMIWPLKAEAIVSTGRETARAMRFHRIKTVGDIANCNEKVLFNVFGQFGRYIQSCAAGRMLRPVRHIMEDGNLSEISNSTAVLGGISTYGEFYELAMELTKSIGKRLHAKKLTCNKIAVAVKMSGMSESVYEMPLDHAADDAKAIAEVAMLIFRDKFSVEGRITSLRISAGELIRTDMAHVLEFRGTVCIQRALESTGTGI